MIEYLHVKKFRAMKNLKIPLGKKITVIAGQNATCKSTLLGMIGQPFGLKKEKTIFNRSFSTKFSDIFKWSRKNDKPGDHEYEIHFYKDNPFSKEVEYVKSFKRSEEKGAHIRLVVGKKRDKGDGNLDYPVIYLGLKRVYPIGELKDIRKSSPTLTEFEVGLFNEWYKKIFFPLEVINPVQITSKLQKDTLAVTSDEYDYFANSSGQDNIGQILGALISFKRLKEKLKENYFGGLLLIDELDATLFPAAQINLIDLLYKQAGKLNLQIIFTTHSLDVLEHIIDKRQHNNGDTEVLYFTRVFGELQLIPNVTMERIRSDLNMTPTGTGKDLAKLNVYCEDKEASWFIKRLLGSQITKNLVFCDATFGAEELKTLARKKIPEFQNSIIVLDGDTKLRKNSSSNIITLPGNGSNPENVFREYLEGLRPDDEFWRNDRNYTKQVFMSQLEKLTNGQYSNRSKMKQWFQNQKNNKLWGYNATLLYRRWLKDNPSEAEEFREKFLKAYNEIARRKSIPPININH